MVPEKTKGKGREGKGPERNGTITVTTFINAKKQSVDDILLQLSCSILGFSCSRQAGDLRFNIAAKMVATWKIAVNWYSFILRFVYLLFVTYNTTQHNI